MPVPVSSCWIVTEGLIGLQNQAIGLAEALGLAYSIKKVPKSNWPFSNSLYKHGLIPPWPDILITCGHSSVNASVAIRKASQGRTFTVHIQDPRIDPKHFDIVIVPEHDQLQGNNVLVTQGAIHHVSSEKLLNAGDHFRPLFALLPRPLMAVLIGGKSQRHDFSVASVRDLSNKLSDAAKSTGGGIAIVTSRRTGPENEKVLREYFRETPAYIWDTNEENPYLGLLALADVIVVTSDSISMISEACFTGKPVYIYELPGGSRRHKQFRENLIQEGIARPFLGNIEAWSYPPFNETQRAADFVRERFLTKVPVEIKLGVAY